MALGPIEVIVIGFPGNRFNGEIIPELEKLVESKTISVIDGVAVVKGADGSVEFVEFDQDDHNEAAQRLAGLFNRMEALVSDEDINTLAADLEPDSSAAILVLEHLWAKPFQEAIIESGGVLTANFRVPAATVDELLAELADLED